MAPVVEVAGWGRPGPRPSSHAYGPPAHPLQEQVSSVRGLLAISLLMMERRDERDVLHLAATAVSALAPCRAVGVLLDSGEWAAPAVVDSAALPGLREVLAACPPDGGPVALAGEAWAWAVPLRTRDEAIGHLVMAAAASLGEDDLVLLRSLAQQTGIAVGNVRLHASKQAANAALARTVQALEHKTAIHDRFTQVALSGGGSDGIAGALCELTGLSAGIEDRGGSLLAWASPGGGGSAGGASGAPAGERADGAGPGWGQLNARARDELIQRSLRIGRPVRGEGRLLAAVRVRHDVVGVLYLVDPDERAGEAETVALEHGSTVLAIELARLFSLAETELRLGVDVLADLVGGTGVAAAVRRAQALGRDLSRPQRVATIGVHRARIEPDALLHAVRGAMPGPHPALLMHRGETVVALLEVRSDADRAAIEALAGALRATRAGRSLRLGVGGVCRTADDVPRSLREAELALRIPQGGVSREAAAIYDDLGVYQLLADVSDLSGIDAFVRRWLGPLVDYDAARGSDLVATLAAFLDTGGRYDATAAELSIGRSTLRYRLARIKEITGADLGDPDVRFQLHLAAKAWFTRQALGGAGR